MQPRVRGNLNVTIMKSLISTFSAPGTSMILSNPVEFGESWQKLATCPKPVQLIHEGK